MPMGPVKKKLMSKPVKKVKVYGCEQTPSQKALPIIKAMPKQVKKK